MQVGAVIPAAGLSKRLGTRRRKPFVRLAGRPILAWTLQALEAVSLLKEIVVVAHRKDLKGVCTMIRGLKLSRPVKVVPGGSTRMESVFQGLRALSPAIRWVAVHDGARPLVTPDLIRRTIQAARKSGAAIAAVPVVPTIKEARGRWVAATLNRSRLWAVQTPQVFRRDWLERAHQRGRANGVEATDDAALVERLGCRVRIVPGFPRNIKITASEDLAIAEVLLRVGTKL